MRKEQSQLPQDYNWGPLPDFLELKESKVEGLGLFASKPIQKGKILGVSHVDVHCTELIYSEGTMVTVSKQFNNGLIRTSLGGYINHGCENPSVEMRSLDKNCSYIFITIRPVEKGEELLINYNKTPCVG